jgi:hypothetical protein
MDPTLQISMDTSLIERKSTQENHPFPPEKFLELPERIQNPVAVFGSKNHTDDFVVLTEIQHDGKSFIVPIEVATTNNGYQINRIKSFYPKDNEATAFTHWLNLGLARYYHRAKLNRWLAEQYGDEKAASAKNPRLGLQLPNEWQTLLSSNVPTDAQVSQLLFSAPSAVTDDMLRGDGLAERLKQVDALAAALLPPDATPAQRAAAKRDARLTFSVAMRDLKKSG